MDIYINYLIRRCQFPQEEQESHKIDLLYHATAHFKVRKFVHNAKQEELKYDHMIEVAKAHERTCQEYQIHKQAHSMANVDTLTTMRNAKHMALHAVSVAIKITGLSNAEAPRGGTVQLVAHPPWEGHRIDKDSSVASMPTKGRGCGDGKQQQQSTPNKKPGQGWGQGGKPFKTNFPLQLLNSCQDQHTLSK